MLSPDDFTEKNTNVESDWHHTIYWMNSSEACRCSVVPRLFRRPHGINCTVVLVVENAERPGLWVLFNRKSDVFPLHPWNSQTTLVQAGSEKRQQSHFIARVGSMSIRPTPSPHAPNSTWLRYDIVHQSSYLKFKSQIMPPDLKNFIQSSTWFDLPCML